MGGGTATHRECHYNNIPCTLAKHTTDCAAPSWYKHYKHGVQMKRFYFHCSRYRHANHDFSLSWFSIYIIILYPVVNYWSCCAFARVNCTRRTKTRQVDRYIYIYIAEIETVLNTIWCIIYLIYERFVNRIIFILIGFVFFFFYILYL